MYISTYSTYAVSIFDIQNLQSSIQTLQQQLNTQQRVNTPSDDPVTATRILELAQATGMNTQFINNTKGVSAQLGLMDNTLLAANKLLSNLKALVVQAGDGALAPVQLQMIQQQALQNFNELLSYANATNGRGDYLFGGNKMDNPPFAADSALNTTYNGDSGVRVIQITSSRTLPLTQAGSLVFGNATSDTAIFDDLQQLYNLLGQNPKPANYVTQLDTIMNNLDNAQNQILTVQAAIGAAEQENNNTQNANESLDVQYNKAIGDLQNLDLAKAISDLTLALSSLQYSQLVYTKMTDLFLFNYIK